MTGCQSVAPFIEPHDSARQLAADRGFSERVIHTDNFDLATFQSDFANQPQTLTVYIEGDGRAFITRRRVSDDPTPRDPVALKLALADPAAAVAYIARPCQLTQPMPANCEPRYWTTHRYAPEVVESMNQAVAALKKTSGARRITLIGYSGGGTIAALIAGRRDDVDWLVTIAGNLDHVAWTTYHNDTPLTGSLNPVTAIEKLAAVNQLHIAGGDDDTMPPALVADFVRALPAATPVEFMVIERIDHNDWPGIWAERICDFSFRDNTPRCSVVND